MPALAPIIPNLTPYGAQLRPVQPAAMQIPVMPPQKMMSEPGKANILDHISQPKASMSPDGPNRQSYSMVKVEDKKWYQNDQNNNLLGYAAHQKETIPFIPPQKTFPDSFVKETIPSTMKPQFKYILPTTRKLPTPEFKDVETTTGALEQERDPNEGAPGEPVVAMLKQVTDFKSIVFVSYFFSFFLRQ